MDQIVQLVGALLILVPFTATQLGRLEVKSATYLVLNLAGSAILASVALAANDWGFLLLNFVWAIVAASGLYGILRDGRPAPVR